jgi:DNA polymerase III alpha subunit
MLPIFKSHYSIGKSILTLKHPDSTIDGASDSIFKILQGASLNKLILVEDSPTGFLQARKISFELDIDLIFGLRINVRSFESDEDKESQHKVIIFAKNDSGSKLLNKIYSKVFCELKGVADYKTLKEFWNEDHLMLAVPFYDSFLYFNSFYFANCVPDFSFCKPKFFIENNNLPTDLILSKLVRKYCKDNSFEYNLSKSIYYNKKSDLEAFQTYKCICNRNFGRKKSLSNPGFDGLGSREFCFESYLEHNK